MGSGGVIVLDEDDSVLGAARSCMEFCYKESCGKCSACRIGTRQMYALLDKISRGAGEMQDIEQLKEIGFVMQTCSLCGLGKAAPNVALSALAKFEREYTDRIADKKCAAGKCRLS